MHEPAVANGLTVDADRYELRVGLEVGPERLELDTGCDSMLFTRLEGRRIETVEPEGIGAILGEMIDGG